jgi:hypothetical protein
MVHALEIIHTLLEPAGILVDIHPSSDPPPIEVRLRNRYDLAGWLKETDDYIEYTQADQAIEAVLRRGLFALEQKGTFTFNTYAPSLAELREYLAETWQDALIDDQVAGRVEQLLQSPETDKEVVLREVVQISRLRSLGLAKTGRA